MTNKILIPIVLLVVIGALAGSLYSKIWNPSWNPFVSPDKVLSEALEKTAELKTYSQKIEISINCGAITRSEATGSFFASGFEGLDNISFSIKSDADVDLTLLENPKSSGDFRMDISLAGISEEQLLSEIAPFVQEGKLTLFLEGEGKQIGKESYLKIKTIPFYPFLNMQLAPLGIDLSEIKDNWIKIDPEAISALTGVKYEGLETEKTKELQEKIKNILKEKKLFSLKSVLKSEKIDNIMCYHYLVSVNSKELKEVISKILDEIQKEYLLGEEIPQEELEKFYQEFDKIWEKLGGIEFEIFIGKKDKFVRLISLEKEIGLEKFADGNKEMSGKANVKLSIGYSNLNQPILITVPREYKNLEEILEPMLMKLMELQGMQAIPTQ